jgi:GTP-binding protein EngB required for normal cell division
MNYLSSKSALQENGTAEPALAVEVGGAGRLLRLKDLAQQLGAEAVAEEARELAERISEGRFYVACLGQSKRGKSTLLNALVGASIVPTGFVPVTAVPTVIRYGDTIRACVRMHDGSWHDIPASDLKHYVTEELNPENKRAVAGAEVFVPSPRLASGMCFVDTPGLGSVFAGNTATTQAFIPHIDAALVVVGADPPIAGEELALLEAVGKQVEDLILILNKADRTTEAERTAAVKFTREILGKRLQRSVEEVFEVSAIERLESHGPVRDWERLTETLDRLVNESGRNLVRAACERGRQRLCEQLLAIVNADRDALERPIEESERRMALVKQTISEAERSMCELSFLFIAEQQRISDAFVERRRKFLKTAIPEAEREFTEALRTTAKTFGPHYRRRAFRLAQEISRQLVGPWLKPEQDEGESEYRNVALRFVDMGNNFLQRLASAGLIELTRMPHALDAEKGLRVRSKLTFYEYIEIAQPASPLGWIADAVLSWVGARQVITNQAREFLYRLMEVNTTRIQSDIVERIQESRSRLEVEIRKLLLEISRIAGQALERARKTKEDGAAAVQASLERLEKLEMELSSFSTPESL